MKKRIGFILKGYPRVSETFIAQEIHLLEGMGFEIDIYSMRGPREAKRQPIVAKIQAPVTYLPEYIWPALTVVLRKNGRVLLRNPARYLGLLALACVRSLRRHDDDPLKRFLQAGWLVGHHSLGKGSAVEHLHSHFAHAPTELAWYAARLSGLKYSISAHAKDIYTISKADLAKRVRDSELVMTCTRFNADFLRALPGVPGEKVHLVHHGLDLEAFAPGERAPWSLETLSQFVSVGRLVEKKGYPDLFSALRLLKDRGHQFTYDIYGDGELSDELGSLSRELGLGDQILFHRSAIQPEIIARLQRGGIFLCGSRVSPDGDRDGIPNTVAEAMAMELPVVATNVSGIPELVEDGVSGILVPERSPAALASAIESLLGDPARAQALGPAARKRVEQIFNAQVCIGACADLLRPFAVGARA